VSESRRIHSLMQMMTVLCQNKQDFCVSVRSEPHSIINMTAFQMKTDHTWTGYRDHISGSCDLDLDL